MAASAYAAPSNFSAAKTSAQADFDRSKDELAKAQAGIAKEKDPLNKELAALEDKLRQLQDQYAPLTREVDQSELNLANLKVQVKLAAEENSYLTNILDEYTKGFESKIHVSEMQRYRPVLDKAKLASENDKTPLKERFMTQVELLRTSIIRLKDVLGGVLFAGQAVDSQGFVLDGNFALIGPMAMFSSNDGKSSGIAMPQVGSLMPIVRSITPEINAAITQLASTGKGLLPLDGTLGAAIKDFVQKHSLMDTYIHGGPIMHPLLVVSILVFGTVIERFFFILREKKRRKPREVHAMLEACEACDFDKAINIGKKSQDYVARVLTHALQNVETDISDSLSLAASLEIKRFKRGFFILDTGMTIAPLLGLLGTVTGMMASFASIGGDMGAPSAITGGIAEALIATAFGLVIAMTALVPFNYLNTMVEDSEHELEVAASKLELIIEKNKKHEEALRLRHLKALASEEAAGLKPISGPVASPLPA